MILKILKVFLIVLLAVMTNGLLSGLHHNLFNLRYEACKAQLIAENNYQTTEQVLSCTYKSKSLRVLGTILFADGSYLGE